MSVTVTLAPARTSPWRPVRRAATLMLWQAAPWVLIVLAALTLLLGALSVWAAWSDPSFSSGPVAQDLDDGGIANGVAIFAALVTVASWARATPATLPVLLTGGLTRRAAVGGVLVGVGVLALACTAVLTVVALLGAVLQRTVEAASTVPTVVAARGSSGEPAFSFAHVGGDPTFSPLTCLAALVVLGLIGVLLGAAWYRWRASGAVVAGAVMIAAWGASSDGLVLVTDGGAGVLWAGVARNVGAALVLALAAWLVLRRVPLRPPAR